MSLYIHYHGYSKTSINKILLKAVVSMTPGSLGSPGDTSIGDLSVDLQIVTIKQLREIIN